MNTVSCFIVLYNIMIMLGSICLFQCSFRKEKVRLVSQVKKNEKTSSSKQDKKEAKEPEKELVFLAPKVADKSQEDTLKQVASIQRDPDKTVEN